MKNNILRISAIAISSMVLANVAYAGNQGGKQTSMAPKANHEGSTMHKVPCMDNKGLEPAHKSRETQMNKEQKMYKKNTMHQEREMREYKHENNSRYNQ
jgi:hypothetical protein